MTTINDATSALIPVQQAASTSAESASPKPGEDTPQFRIVEDEVILSDEAKKMLEEIGDIGDYRPERMFNRYTLTYRNGDQVTGKDLAYGLANWDDAVGMKKWKEANAAQAAAYHAAHLGKLAPRQPAAVESDPQWESTADKMIGYGRSINTPNPFVWKNYEFADAVEHRLSKLDDPGHLRTRQGDENFTSRLAQDFKTEMEGFGILDEAREFFTSYMQQKHGRDITLDSLFERFGIA